MGQPADHRASLADLADRWSRLHHGLRPSPLVLAWLRPLWAMARPLAAARVPATAITLVGMGLAVAAAVVAGPAPLVALVLVLAAAVCDGLDGAVVVVRDRPTRGGTVIDHAADRVADTAFALTIWRCGAPLWLCIVAAALALLLELGRPPRMITVAERPIRVICAVLACAAAAVSDATWPPTVCAGVWVGATAVAIGQISS